MGGCLSYALLEGEGSCSVFVSYRSKTGNAFAAELVRWLKRDGVASFFAAADMVDSPIPNTIHDVIAHAPAFLALVTQEYGDSPWVREELAHVLTSLNTEGRPKLIVILGPGAMECDVPVQLRNLRWRDFTSLQAILTEYPLLCLDLGGKPSRIELGEESFRKLRPTRTPMKGAFFGVIPRSREGRMQRTDDLWEIDRKLSRSSVLIVGMPGSGKSTLAIEYARRFAGRYAGGVYWIRAEAFPTPELAVKEFAREQRIAVPDGPGLVDAFWSALRPRGQCLVVIDNFPESTPLWSPPDAGGSIRVLITSRQVNGDIAFARHWLQAFEVPDALGLLCGPDTLDAERRTAALELVQELGCLPLAVELARAAIEQAGGVSNCAGFLSSLRKTGVRYLEDVSESRSIWALFSRCFDACPSDARSVLDVLGMLAPEPVPIDLLRKTLPLEAVNDVEMALRRLAAFSLVNLVDGMPLAHRLVVDFARTAAEARPAYADLVSRLENAVHDMLAPVHARPDAETLRALSPVVSHASVVAKRASDRRSPIAFRLHHGLWRNYFDRGDFGLASHHAQWARDAVGFLDSKRERDRATCVSTHDLAKTIRQERGIRICGGQEPARDSLSLYEEALALAKTLPGEDALLAQILSDLANARQNSDEYEIALDHARRAVQIARDLPEQQRRPVLASSLLAFGRVSRDIGARDAALSAVHDGRKALEEAVQIRAELFGMGSRDYATAVGDLAGAWRQLGDLPRALALARQAVDTWEGWEQRAGWIHPLLSNHYRQLGMVYRDLRRLDESLAWLNKAVERQLKLQEVHARTAIALGNRALVLAALGRLLEAERDALKALEIQTQVSRHDSVAMALRFIEISEVLNGVGRPDEAANKHVPRAYEILVNRGMQSSGDMGSLLRVRAEALSLLGYHDKAVKDARASVRVLRKGFGPSHPRTVRAKEALKAVLVRLKPQRGERPDAERATRPED